jgi:RNA polymerase sigma-70 factor (ECF subfamily)
MSKVNPFWLGSGAGQFTTTHWSVVLAAGQEPSPEAAQALADLCHAYWYPLYTYVRRKGYDVADAQDLTQEFFARLLERNYLGSADRRKGKFRSFLLASLEHFLAKEWVRAHRLKRGGGLAPVSLDACLEQGTSRGSGQFEPSSDPGDINFDREWALAVMFRATNALEEEFRAEGKADQFRILKLSLVGDGSGFSLADAAPRLSVSEATLRVTVHRFRKRFRDLVRGEISQTLRDPELVDEELRHLIEALSSAR